MSPSFLRWRGSVQSSSTDLKSTPEIEKKTLWNDERVAIQWSQVMRWVVWSQIFYFLLYIDHFYIVLTLDIFEKDEGIKGRPIAGLAGKHKILVWNMGSGERSEWAPRARLLLSYVFEVRVWCIAMLVDSIPLVGCRAFPFIGQEKARVTADEERRTKERGSPSWSPGLSFPLRGSHWHCRWWQRWLHGEGLSTNDAMPWHCQQVVMSHPTSMGGAANQRADQRSYRE